MKSTIAIIILAYIFLTMIVFHDGIESEKIENITTPTVKKDTNALLLYEIGKIPDTVTLKKGDTLYKTLGMSNEQAEEFAKKYGKKYWKENGLLYVIVHEGEQYVKEWRPVEKPLVVQRNYLWMKNLRPDRMKSF